MKLDNADSILLLQHELTMARAVMLELSEELTETAELVGEAMSQSSETWHDNAPGDAALEELAKARGRAAVLRHVILNHQVVEYPEMSDPRIQIGSVATLHIPDWSETIKVLVSGGVRNLYSEASYFGLVDEVVSYSSPLASAVIHLAEGDQGLARINDKEVQLEVRHIDQEIVIAVASRTAENAT
jgi:transcription elongation GreA/GreB family factor